MSTVSMIIYKALDDMKKTCQTQEKCSNCVYLEGCHQGGVPSPFPSSWEVDTLTDLIISKAFKGG